MTVPQSYTAHQARDHAYYRRHNFNVLPMEDYELRDVMNRRKRPKISASIFAARNVGGDGYVLVRLNNIGSVLAKDYMVDLQVPIDLAGHISVEEPAFLENHEGKYFYSFRLGPNALRLPLFPDSHVTLRRKFATGVTVRSTDGLKLPSSDAVVVALYVDERSPIRATIPAQRSFANGSNFVRIVDARSSSADQISCQSRQFRPAHSSSCIELAAYQRDATSSPPQATSVQGDAPFWRPPVSDRTSRTRRCSMRGG